MFLPRLFVMTAVCLWTPLSAWAEPTPASVAPAMQTPEEVAKAALEAMRESRLGDYARMMHPEAAANFKQMMLPVFSEAFENGEEQELLSIFPEVESLAQLEMMDSAEFFQVFLEGVFSARPDFQEVLAGTEMTVLGSVAEGDSHAHVVYRGSIALEEVKVTKVGVVSFQRTETGWGMLLSGEFEGLANALQQRFGPEQ